MSSDNKRAIEKMLSEIRELKAQMLADWQLLQQTGAELDAVEERHRKEQENKLDPGADLEPPTPS